MEPDIDEATERMPIPVPPAVLQLLPEHDPVRLYFIEAA